MASKYGGIPVSSGSKFGGIPVDAPEIQANGGLVDQLTRQAGLTGRAVMGGLAQAAEPFTEPVRYLMNQALPGNPIGNIEQATDSLATRAGLPQAETPIEKGVQSVGRFATGAGAGVGLERGISNLIGKGVSAVSNAAPSTSELKQMAQAAYKAADDAGLVINPSSFKSFTNRLIGVAKHAGIDRDIHPKATAAMRRIQETVDDGAPITLQDFDTLRRIVNGAKSSIEKDERRIGKLIGSELDDYLARMGGSDVIAGDPKAANAALTAARTAWTRMSKSEMIEDAVKKAGRRAGQFSGSGFENALRTQFRQIGMNDKKMRGFTQAEQAAIDKIAMGGPLDNAMRTLGKLAPTGTLSMIMSPAAGYGMGSVMGSGTLGAVGGVAVPAIGAVARRAATEMTKRNVDNLSDLVRRGGPAAKETPEWLLPWLSGGMFGADVQGN